MDEKTDGFNVWDTISSGAPSPRDEILINIDTQYMPQNEGDAFPTTLGTALRYKDWKLVQNAPDAEWFMPPEKGGILEPGTGGKNVSNVFKIILVRDKVVQNLLLRLF